MAKKTETIVLEQIRKGSLIVTIEGMTDLLLKAMPRSTELEQIFKQSHPKGTKIPAKFTQPYCLWEKLITSIHWQNPITFHDDDWSLYTEDEWKDYMKNNKPCILGKAFKDSFKETFVSCGFKETTGKAGTDFNRTVSISALNPVTFVEASYEQTLPETSGLNRTKVLTETNRFSGWKCDFKISYLESAFPKETLMEIISYAGEFIGIGARRGEGYGRYCITNMKTAE